MQEFPVPRRRDELIAKGAFLHGKNLYSPTVNSSGYGTVLNFRSELSLYHDRILSKRAPYHLSIIEDISRMLRFNRQATVLCCVLCHVEEDLSSSKIGDLVNCITDAGGHTIIFLNGVNAHGADTLLLEAERGLYQKLKYGEKVNDRVSIIGKLFERREPLSTVRGILADAVAITAEGCGLEDPIITSTDIDMLAIPQNYGGIINNIFKNPTVDILSGPVFYGYSCEGTGYFDMPLRAPELMLGNRVIHTRHWARISGVTLGEPFFPTDGPNIVFRMSAYCAAGGYNYEVDLGEDIYIGAAIFGLRNEKLELFPRPSHAVYSPELWLATDPRRQLSAICAGYSIVESWSFIPFSDILGSSMSTKELISAYALNKELIQHDDLRALDISSVSDKIKRRTLAVFRDAVKDDYLDDEAMRSLGNRYGLIDVSDCAESYNLTSEMMGALKTCSDEYSH